MVKKTTCVFLSSTAKDLAEYREAACRAIERLTGYHCDRMENWGARDDEADHFSLAGVEKCDLFVGIVGHCYGSLPKGKRKSYTEREYDAAKKAGKPRLMFVAPDDFPLPASLIEADDKRGKQAAFRKRVDAERVRASFRSAEELATAIVQAIHAWEKTRARAPTRRPGGGGPTRVADFVQAYREALSGLYTNWDLGSIGVAEAGATRAFTARLDDMYEPLRLDERYDISETKRGNVIGAKEILALKRPLAITGQPGSGKTTWTKHTFRALLHEEKAVPFVVELRRLAREWGGPKAKGKERSLEGFLVSSVAEHVEGAEKGVKALLDAKTGPRPVLLVDGWDELGDLGEDLRAKLVGLLARHPRVRAVVTSRPYGEGRPSHSDGFDSLWVQPLADPETAALAGRFFERLYVGEPARSAEAWTTFGAALERSDEARTLARTPLLLTMMLIVSRSAPLPDKRHQLYGKCIESLLTALPDKAEASGVQRPFRQWRPDDGEERLRVTAALAFAAQCEQVAAAQIPGAAILRTWGEMAACLPEDWKKRDRDGFLAWLAERAGLLALRTDNTLQFAHLSFQEYLAAWRLKATTDGPEARGAAVAERTGDQDWWEMLRLWAALVEAENPEYLRPVLEDLTSGDGLWLAGSMFADGLGSEDAFCRWAGRLLEELAVGWHPAADYCVSAWSGSGQERRQEELQAYLQRAGPDATWLAFLRLRDWGNEALGKGIPGEGVWLPKAGTNSRAVIDGPDADDFGERNAAAGRVLVGAAPTYPGRPGLWLLNAWPSYRRIAGTSLQGACDLGQGRCLLRALMARTLTVSTRADAHELARDLVLDWARHTLVWVAREWVNGSVSPGTAYLARDWARYCAGDWVPQWARDVARDEGRTWAHDVLLVLARYRGPDATRDWASRVARDWARYWARHWARDVSCDVARDLARDLVPAFADEPWALDFARVELFPIGRASAMAILALRARAGSPEGDPAVSLLSQACLQHHEPERPPDDLRGALEAWPADGEPLWPALARHIAGWGTGEDRALLEHLAQHPEEREPPLSWGLKYIVRGDVMLDDGTVVTLDELCDELGLPRLPYIEDMPPLLEIDWEE